MKNYYIRRAFDNFVNEVIACHCKDECTCDESKCIAIDYVMWENFGTCEGLDKSTCYIFPRWLPNTTTRVGISCCMQLTGFYEIRVSCPRSSADGSKSLDELTDCIMGKFACVKRLEYVDEHDEVFAIQLTQAVSRSPAFIDGERFEATISIPYTVLSGCC